VEKEIFNLLKQIVYIVTIGLREISSATILSLMLNITSELNLTCLLKKYILVIKLKVSRFILSKQLNLPHSFTFFLLNILALFSFRLHLLGSFLRVTSELYMITY
jgi:hypothetical protein